MLLVFRQLYNIFGNFMYVQQGRFQNNQCLQYMFHFKLNITSLLINSSQHQTTLAYQLYIQTSFTNNLQKKMFEQKSKTSQQQSQENSRQLHSPFREIENSTVKTQNNNQTKEMANEENFDIDVQLSQSKKAMLQRFMKNVETPINEQIDINKSVRLDSFRPPRLTIPRQSRPEQQKFSKTDSLTFSLSTQNDRYSHKKLIDNNSQVYQSKNGVKDIIATFNEKGKSLFGSEQTQENHEQIRYLNKFFCEIGLLQVQDIDKQLPEVYRTISKKHQYLKKTGKIRQLQECIKNQQQNQAISPLYNNKNRNGIIKKPSINSNKKVTLVTPQNILELKEIRSKWKNQLKQTMQFLSQGMIFKKYCYNRQKIQTVRVFFSTDFRFISWKRVNTGINLLFCRLRGKQIIKVQNMLEFQGIAPGLKSRNFQRYLKLNYPLKDNRIFSILFTQRSLDLQAQNRQQKSKFINAIKTIKSFINN